MRAHVALLVVALTGGLVACGDPRDAFVGKYIGTGSATITANGDTWTEPWPTMQLELAAPDATTDLVFVGNPCGLRGEVTGGDAFTVLPRACPAEKVDTSNGNYCWRNQTIDSGSAKLVGDTLTVNYRGIGNFTGCTDGFPDGHATYDSTMTVTRH